MSHDVIFDNWWRHTQFWEIPHPFIDLETTSREQIYIGSELLVDKIYVTVVLALFSKLSTVYPVHREPSCLGLCLDREIVYNNNKPSEVHSLSPTRHHRPLPFHS